MLFRNAVGNGRDNEPDDVLNAKRALTRLGRYRAPRHGRRHHPSCLGDHFSNPAGEESGGSKLQCSGPTTFGAWSRGLPAQSAEWWRQRR
jgi:hypothetical protein